MKPTLLCTIIIFICLTSCFNNSRKALIQDSKEPEMEYYVDSTDLFGSRIYKHFTPNQFLENLANYKVFAKGLYFVVYIEAPSDWIKKEDIDTLILRVLDTTRVPCVVNPLSSYLPTNSNSCIGREAQMMIKSYIEKKGYLHFLYSCGSVDSLEAKKLIDWYNQKI